MPRRATFPEFEALLRAFRRQRPLRAHSLVITIFGDVVSVHGGEIWLGSLIAALGQFRVAERLTRTSVYRLRQDGWLEVNRQGRRSYVRFTAHGQREYDRAALRIYAAARPVWDGNWTLVLAREVPRPRRAEFRKAMNWAGYGELAPDLYAHPSADRRALMDLLDETELAAVVVVMSAQTLGIEAQRNLTSRIVSVWSLDELARRYRRFIARFERIEPALSVREPAPAQAFVMRTLLVHEYRRLLLQDPDIPAPLLAADWPGEAALSLTARVYHRMADPSLKFIATALSGRQPLPAPDAKFRQRFR
jgi:phenylacetic acid degradation operon negative regulatory protein